MNRRPPRPLTDVTEDYRILVARNPHEPNRDIAARLGMTEAALERALARARRKGLLDIWRVGGRHAIDIARRGERTGGPLR